jgi:DNA-binding HxlR family transcriptional regulator
MAAKRTYGDNCGIARALDLVGERWALLVVRELLLGPKRFTDLRAGLPNASPNVLSQRLDELERSGLVQRRKLPPPASSWVYELTDWGREIEPVVISLGRWGARSPLIDPEGALSVDSMVLAVRTFFDTGPATWSATFELGFGEDRFTLRVVDGALAIERGPATAPPPDATIETTPNALLAALLGQGLEALEVTGDKRAVKRLLDAVRLPELALIDAA